jgi:hypothetical protein
MERAMSFLGHSQIPTACIGSPLLARIEHVSMDFVRERLIADKKISPAEWDSLCTEFKKFIYLIGLGVHPVAMISPKLDELWHQFVLFTREYDRFCSETVGFFIHHTPETEEHPIPLEAANNLISAYEQHFGSLPAVWLDGLDAAAQLCYSERPLKRKPPVRWSGWTGPE